MLPIFGDFAKNGDFENLKFDLNGHIRKDRSSINDVILEKTGLIQI